MKQWHDYSDKCSLKFSTHQLDVPDTLTHRIRATNYQAQRDDSEPVDHLASEFSASCIWEISENTFSFILRVNKILSNNSSLKKKQQLFTARSYITLGTQCCLWDFRGNCIFCITQEEQLTLIDQSRPVIPEILPLVLKNQRKSVNHLPFNIHYLLLVITVSKLAKSFAVCLSSNKMHT